MKTIVRRAEAGPTDTFGVQEVFMFRRIDDVLRMWEGESESTGKVLAQLTDESLHQRVTPDGRSLGFLAWHLATSIPEMMNRTGLTVEGAEHGPAPGRIDGIRRAYEEASRSLLVQMRTHWTDASLEREVDMYGERWQNGFTVFALIAHQAHHRGQMTVLMRQAGLSVPGVYGPAREEWAAMGMPAME
jgi:uncharacterized damage-inducible protein DinB